MESIHHKKGIAMKKIALILLLLPIFTTIKSNEIENQTETEQDINNLRVDTTSETSSKPILVWTKPVIINEKNQDFDENDILKLENNIIYKPGLKYNYPSPYGSYPAAIIVAKDNITIDLNGYILSLDPSSAPNFLTNSPVYGIAVVPGVKNLKIISSSSTNNKGIITGFSDYAIYINGLNESYNSYDIHLNRVKNVFIDNIFITKNLNGIYITNALEVTISNTNIIYNYTSRPFYGIYFSNIIEGVIDTCKINLNSSFTHLYGINLEDTINITVQNSQTNINQSSQTGNVTGILLTTDLATSYANNILNCQANGNLCSFVTGKKSIGFNINNESRHNLIENCSSFLCSHISGSGSATTEGIGFQVDAAEHNQIHNNKSAYNDTYGFYDSAEISSSLWTSNTGIFNTEDNYNIVIPTSSGSTSLPTIVVTQDDITAYVAAGPVFANISVELA